VLSCRRRSCELNWRQVKTVGDRHFPNWTCLMFSSHVLCWNAGLDKTVQSQIYWGLLKTVLTCYQFSSHHRQDETVCLVFFVSAVWARHKTLFSCRLVIIEQLDVETRASLAVPHVNRLTVLFESDHCWWPKWFLLRYFFHIRFIV